VAAVRNLGGIEFAGDGGALARRLFLRRHVDRLMLAVAFAGAARGGFSEAEPPQSEAEHDGGGDDAEAWRCEGRGAEERHGDGILQGRGAWQCRHGEGHGAESDRRRNKPARDVGGLEQALRHGNENEEGNEQAHAAIGDNGAGEGHGENRSRCPERLGHEPGDGFDRATVVHQFAEQGTEEKEREELREELRGAAHEGFRPMGKQRLPCGGSRDEGRGRRQQQHAPAAIGQPDEKP
jgi:hypothetical protein